MMLKPVIAAAALMVLAVPAFALPDDSVAPARPVRERATQDRTGGLMRYDANKDGYVDRAEWMAGQEARFTQLDTNGDGKLSPDELNRTPAGAVGVLPNDARSRRASAYFQRMDIDRDGFVSKAEFMEQATRNFERCDVDKDGRITVAECRQALGRRSTQR